MSGRFLQRDSAGHWTADEVAEAAGGRWIISPPKRWFASGLCIHGPTMQAGNLVVVRGSEPGSKGIQEHLLSTLPHPPAGIITSSDMIPGPASMPVLRVGDTGVAILAMGRHARERMTGKVLAVTGSAGKTTTVAMLAHVLSAWGRVGRTGYNANLPHGVAWNLASMPLHAPHIVLELAIGRMGQSARMARPDIAVFTNIFPAHLGEGSSLRDIARTKSAIFSAMSPGGVAVINRNMLEWETVHAAATARKLEVFHFGTTGESDFQLLDYDAGSKRVSVRLRDEEHGYSLPAAGKHMALNSLAILAAVSALGLPLEQAFRQLETFQPLPGRGEESEVIVDGKRITMIDDAYNANPGSMTVALEQLSLRVTAGRKIAVLGEMADLGPEARRYHSELSTLIDGLDIDRFYVTGELYSEFWESLPRDRRGGFEPSLSALRLRVFQEIADGDTVLFKGSNSAKIYQIVSWLAQQSVRTR